MNSTGGVIDYLACYDNETKVMTDEGLKYFADLTGDEMVMTLNAETGEKEWQVPMERQVFEYEGEMYRFETDEGDLLVSPEHNVYFKKAVNDEKERSIIEKILNFGGGLFKLLIYVV